MRYALAAACVAVSLAASGAALDRGAQLFLDKCAACHSIGGGDLAAPDLVVARQRTPTELRAAVHRMEENVGSLTVDEVDSLVALLKNPNAKALVALPAQPAAAPVEAPRGVAPTGRQLFFGERRFANGGTPCFACHAAGGRGGNLAVDLSLVHKRMNRAALATAAQQPPFPLMKAAYATHPITEDEAYDVAAFLNEPGSQPAERSDVLHGAAAGAAIVVLAGVGLILRTRRAGVRSRMVRDTNRPGGE